MGGKQKVLSVSQARAYYDSFGKKQDSQGIYEDSALDDIIAHADFPHARRIFEFGSGTGKFAERLFLKHFSESATYLGCDISPVMIRLAEHRLSAYGGRAKVVQTDGSVNFPLADQSVDRVISNYVLDLLSESDIRLIFGEAHRVLIPGGKICLASLTKGIGLPSRIVSFLWMVVFKINASWVGGCRPIRFEPFIDPEKWMLEHKRVLAPFGIASEVLVLSAKQLPYTAILN